MYEQLQSVNNGLNDATSAIQALLDRRGDVYIPSGTYLISRPLIIYSNTRLTLAPDATLRVADHANCALLDNDGLRTHERSHDITVIGGRWDGNHENQERMELEPGEEFCEEKYISNVLLALMIRMVHIDRLTMRDMVLVNPTTYAVHIADARYFTVENMHLDYALTKYNMDGIHIQGPARFGVIRNIYGAGNDDQVALCTEGTARSQITRGDIEDITINGVYSENGYTGVRLLSCGSTLRNVDISNVCGTYRYYAVSFTHHYALTPDTRVMLENVHIHDLRVGKSTSDHWTNLHGPLIWFAENVRCRNVVIENIFRYELNRYTNAPLVGIDPNVYINTLVLRNLLQIFDQGREVIPFRNQGDIRNLITDESCK